MIGYPVQLEDGQCVLFEGFLGLSEADHYLTDIFQRAYWSQPEIRVFGKYHKVPRLSAWYGDADSIYTYSGLTQQPLEWFDTLLTIKNLVQDETGHGFNSVLLNYYRDGNDGMGRHSDDEAELGVRPVIASVSLGQTRRFVFKHRYKASIPAVSIELTHGSLLLMSGTTQQFWHHSLPKTRRSIGPRLNLTYRTVFGPQFREQQSHLLGKAERVLRHSN